MGRSTLFERYWLRLPVVSLGCALASASIGQGDVRLVFAVVLAMAGSGFLITWAHRVSRHPHIGSPSPRLGHLFVGLIHPRLRAMNDDSDIETLVAVATSMCIAVSIAALFLI